MSNPIKADILSKLDSQFGGIRKLENSDSLYDIKNGKGRIYFRYSKKHPKKGTFFGLRKIDLKVLEGHASVICFCWDDQKEPLFVPFTEFEEIFSSLEPAADGQYKAQIYESEGGSELYIPKAGRFNVESYFGWAFFESLIKSSNVEVPKLSHSQVQTLLGGIGAAKGFDIWIPPADREKLDWALTTRFQLSKALPPMLGPIKHVADEIDVVWIARGGNQPAALYEVEHSTPIYSGLLRFNDIHLLFPSMNLRFGIVSNQERRSLFTRQIDRPTFQASGLKDICTFFEYRNVFGWHNRLQLGDKKNAKVK